MRTRSSSATTILKLKFARALTSKLQSFRAEGWAEKRGPNFIFQLFSRKSRTRRGNSSRGSLFAVSSTCERRNLDLVSRTVGCGVQDELKDKARAWKALAGFQSRSIACALRTDALAPFLGSRISTYQHSTLLLRSFSYQLRNRTAQGAHLFL